MICYIQVQGKVICMCLRVICTRVTSVAQSLEESFLQIELVYIEFHFILDFIAIIGSIINWINI